jgi:iron complex transport system substrate-binding protein
MYLFPEAKARVVALTKGRQEPGDFLTLVDPAFDQKTMLGPDTGPEQIAPLNPDVVVLRSFMLEKLGKPLEQIGIPTVCVDLETPDQYFRDVGTLGQLFGNEARAREIEAFYQTKLDSVKNGLQDLDAKEKPGVLILQQSAKGGKTALNVPSAGWIQTTEAELAGGAPIWKAAAGGSGWTIVNFEQIAAWNPDMIFVISYHSDSSDVVQALTADSRWQALQAVQARQIYGFGADIFSWDQPDPRWILGALWLAGKIHPDRFPDLDMRQEVSQFFGEMYSLDEATIREHILPSLKGDVE